MLNPSTPTDKNEIAHARRFTSRFVVLTAYHCLTGPKFRPNPMA
jgi:hypothetical protein